MNLSTNIPNHRSNVVVQKHTSVPYALSAVENAYLEECNARERETHKEERKAEFKQSLRLSLLERLQQVEHDRERENRLMEHKIKKLLSETIEFSQKTAMA
jgi:spore germination cell wall hydrolase CwlJ-like protein